MRVFVDTSALYALVDDADPHHREAVGSLRGLQGTADLVTHNYVLVEAISLVRRRLGAGAELRLIDVILPVVRTVWIDEVTHHAATGAYRAAGRSGSLVDFVSFEVMRQLGIEVAFAYDADFERRGFPRPPVQPPETPEHRLSEAKAPYQPDAAPSDELVSVAEIAARSGRSTNTIQSWRRRHRDFPAPSASLATGPVWMWPPVARWIEDRARLRPSVLEFAGIAGKASPRIPATAHALDRMIDEGMPTVPLFESGLSDLASRADEHLEGFGGRYEATREPRQPGIWKGRVVIHPNFDDPLPEFEESLEAPLEP